MKYFLNNAYDKNFFSKKNFLFFVVALVAKVAILFLFSSEYSASLFLPFIKTAIHHFKNPWQFYLQNNLSLDAFPYHPLMLYIISPFVVIIEFFEIKNVLFVNFLFKLPLLIFDIFSFFLILKMFPLKIWRVYFYYFLNPVIFYAIYVHSQLDIIPTFFLLLSIYYLFLKKLNLSAVSIGLALITKLHILISIPLILIYILNKYKVRSTLWYLFIVIGIFIIGDFPFVFSEGFFRMVLMNPKQFLLFDSYYQIGNIKILLPFISILFIYFHFFTQKKVNNDLLSFYFGILFTLIIFFIYPAPAWYVWQVPFITIYFIQNSSQKKTILFHSFFSVIYLVFFIFFYKNEYHDILFLDVPVILKIDNPQIMNFMFTMLEAILLSIMYSFYKFGVKSNSIYKKQDNLVIGIGGDSGVGKTSLLKNIRMLLKDDLLEIEGDGEHKWERGNINWKKYTHLDPKANYIHKQADAISELKKNRTIYRQEYDHDSGVFTDPVKILPKPFIAISGLHPFYLPKLRKIIDLKIYIDTDENLRRYWKIVRDMDQRGYSLGKILEQIERRTSDTIKYIYPQKSFADLIIRFYCVEEINFIDYIDRGNTVKIGLQLTIDANIHIENLLNILNVEYEWDYNEDLKTQFIRIQEEPNVDFSEVAKQNIINMNEIVSNDSQWLNGYQGLIQYIIILMIGEKFKEEG